MSDRVRPWGLSALLLVAGVGIAGWWVYWFASGAYQHGQPCDLSYENSFPLADSIYAIASLYTLAVLGRGPADRTAATAGALTVGMALSLATLDTAHNLVTGGFDHFPAALRKAIFALVSLGVALGLLHWLRKASWSPIDGPWRLVGPGVALAVTVGAGLWWLRGDGCGGVLAIPGISVGILECAIGIALFARSHRTAAFVLAGALVHTLGVAALHLLL